MRFLLVDDDVAIRYVVRRSLVRTYPHVAVHEAGNADEALRWLDAAPAGPLVVVSDYSMPPGLDGLSLLARVKLRRPEARRFLLTGFALEGIGPAVHEHGLDGVLEKDRFPDQFLLAVAPFAAPAPNGRNGLP